ncbi:MAG: hypothetical protein PHR83_05030 [Paludibacter sp.]|nr:hypothetical protein [Paludibacter sp.]
MNKELLPFGKYKGQPIEILFSDKDYTKWLLEQSWFKEKHLNLYSVVINNFQEPTETPEHNSIQGYFLDDIFCVEFYKKVYPNELPVEDEKKYKTQINNFNVIVTLGGNTKERIVWNKNFELNGIDVSYNVVTKFSKIISATDTYDESSYISKIKHKGYIGNTLKIEIKPTVSDDYPVVLRQMIALKANCLFLREYTGIGIDKNQFIQLFKQQNIKVLFENEVF